MTYGDFIGWGLGALLWLGVIAGSVALAFGIAICGAFVVRAFRK